MPTQPVSPTTRRSTRRGAWVGGRAVLAVALALATLAGRLRRFAVAELSMAPELAPGDFLITVVGSTPEVGDLVVYSTPDRPDFHLVKRVVAIGPCTVRLDLGIVSVDGQAMDEPWAHGAGRDGRWDLRKGEVFVLGDDRTLSTGDSASVGAIAARAIHSVVRFRYWPLRRIGQI